VLRMNGINVYKQAGASLLGLFMISLPFIQSALYKAFLKLHVRLSFLLVYSLWRHIGS
jgi:hypothetical protein